MTRNEEIEILDVDYDDNLGFANNPLKDNEGYVKGKLIEIKNHTLIDKKKRTSTEFADDITKKCLMFIFSMEGTTEPIRMSKLTGTNIRPEKIHVKAKGRGKDKEQPEYNALTEMCLRLGVFKHSELKTNNKELIEKIRLAMKNTSPEKPVYIKTKLQLIDNEENQFESINMKTIQVIDKF